MPVYEYQCSSCGHKFELRRALDESDSGIACPKCGSRSPQRVFSSFGMGSSSPGGACAPSRPT